MPKGRGQSRVDKAPRHARRLGRQRLLVFSKKTDKHFETKRSEGTTNQTHKLNFDKLQSQSVVNKTLIRQQVPTLICNHAHNRQQALST